MDKIIKHKNKKVWLTVSVTLTDNTRFTIIDKLPFNTSDYYDALIKLEDRFKSNLLLNRADLLDSITFIYYIKERKLDSSFLMIKKTHILCIFALLIVIFSNLFYFSQLPCFIEIPFDTINEGKPNKCLFSLFDEYFKISNSSYMHYPSHFLPNSNNVTNVKYDQEPARSLILDCVRYEQYATLNYITDITLDHIKTMRNITDEYSNMVKDLISGQ
jgi:hypothetical protein